MTTRTDLRQIISNGENSGIVFARDGLQPHELATDLVALANLEGGMVLLGVEENGTVSGLVRDGPEAWVTNACRDTIRPAIVPYVDVIPRFEGDRDIAVVRVTRGYGVHAVWHDQTSRYVLRVGSRSREYSQAEVSRMFPPSGGRRPEVRPVSGTTLDDLDRRRLRTWFADIREQETPVDDDHDAWRFLLESTGLMTDAGATVGGMLLFGRSPRRFLPHAGIDAAAWPVGDANDHAGERASLRGPMTPVLSDGGTVVENGLVEQALEFVRRHAYSPAPAGGADAERPVYPPAVVRESVVNALIHRDYALTNATIALTVFRDRLEIASPGGLPDGMTPERLRVGARWSRNELLKDAMRDYGYLDRMGMGVRRRIVRGMMEHNGADPELIEEDDRFVVRLFA